MTSQANVNLPSIQILLSNIEQKPEPPQPGPPAPPTQPSYSYHTMYSTSGSAPIPVSTPIAINTPLYREPYGGQYNVSYETPMPQYQPYMQVNGFISPVAGPQVTNMDSLRSAHILKSLSVQTQDVPRYQQPIMHMSTRVPVYNQLPTPALHKVPPIAYYEHNGGMIHDGTQMDYSTEMTKIMPASPSSISSHCSSRTSSSSSASTSTSVIGNQKSLKKCTCKKSPGSAEHIPRPRNAFILFRQHLHYSIFPKDRYMLVTQGSFKTNSEVSREIGKRWRQLPADEKKYWQDLAQKEKEMHKQKYPDYKYAPRKLMESQDSNSDSDETSGHHSRQRRRQREPCTYCKLKKRSNN